MDGDQEARLRRLEDLMEIHQLFIDYGAHLDAGDFEAYSQLFATDGELKLGPVARAKGRDQIREVMSANLSAQVGQSFHIISSPRVVLDGDRATSEVMWSAIHRGADGRPVLSMLGRHRDELVREDGRWRIQVRRGLIDVPNSFPGA